MVHPRTLAGRLVSLVTVAALATNACAAGVEYGVGSLMGLVRQVIRTNPGPYTDLPRQPYLGDNPKREPRTRGGIWDAKSLQAIDSASPLIASLESGLFFALPVSAEAGAPYAWEGSSANADHHMFISSSSSSSATEMYNKHVACVQILVLFAAILSLCSAQDRSNQGYSPKDGFVPTKEVAIKIAAAILEPIYGKARISAQSPLTATEARGVWTVRGSIPSRSWIGGVAVVKLSRADGRVLLVNHGR